MKISQESCHLAGTSPSPSSPSFPILNNIPKKKKKGVREGLKAFKYSDYFKLTMQEERNCTWPLFNCTTLKIFTYGQQSTFPTKTHQKPSIKKRHFLDSNRTSFCRVNIPREKLLPPGTLGCAPGKCLCSNWC